MVRTAAMLYWIPHVNALRFKNSVIKPFFLFQVISSYFQGISSYFLFQLAKIINIIALQKGILRSLIYCKGCINDLRTALLCSKHSILLADQICYFKLMQNIHKNKGLVVNSSTVLLRAYKMFTLKWCKVSIKIRNCLYRTNQTERIRVLSTRTKYW